MASGLMYCGSAVATAVVEDSISSSCSGATGGGGSVGVSAADGGVTFLDGGSDREKLLSRTHSSPRMASRSFSSDSSRFMSEYRYESSLGESTRGVDILRRWTGVAEDSREAREELWRNETKTKCHMSSFFFLERSANELIGEKKINAF